MSNPGQVPFQCVLCKKSYKGSKTYRNHLENYHSSRGIHKCAECDATLPTAFTLKQHNAKKHTIYQCPQCQRNFRTKTSLRYHGYSHDVAKRFHCPQPGCQKAFSDPKRLSEHKLKQHTANINAKQYICEICAYPTNVLSNLLVHRRRHTAVPEHCCEYCGKCFGTAPQLTAHHRTHTSDRPYVCDVCGVTFRQPKALYHHRPLHNGVKQYECQVCGKRFGQAAGLSQHRQRHRQQLERATDACQM